MIYFKELSIKYFLLFFCFIHSFQYFFYILPMSSQCLIEFLFISDLHKPLHFMLSVMVVFIQLFFYSSSSSPSFSSYRIFYFLPISLFSPLLLLSAISSGFSSSGLLLRLRRLSRQWRRRRYTKKFIQPFWIIPFARTFSLETNSHSHWKWRQFSSLKLSLTFFYTASLLFVRSLLDDTIIILWKRLNVKSNRPFLFKYREAIYNWIWLNDIIVDKNYY